MKNHHIIYVPGLNDQHVINRNLTPLVPLFWKLYGVQTHLLAPRWEEGKEFKPKLERILQKIDELYEKGYIVSLVGQSAGGSAVLNAYAERKKKIHGVINVTGRLRAGVHVTLPLAVAARYSPALRESVLLFEKKNELRLSKKDRQKVMTIRPVWDETVPVSTVSLQGAYNITAPIVEHTIGGSFILTIYVYKLFEFLNTLD